MHSYLQVQIALMARTFHRHRHGDENVQSKCQQFFFLKKMIFKKKKMKCTKGMEIYTIIRSGICFIVGK